ncbi:hypothetical protein F5J12DRAFT_906612 [Pisolithus orientalis]|uniref:uncharacterized protein n=1 Tax=Pisolithus orientalis TaxID=936130 RepID=UPI0022240553|nr:uncharacterized protein F5J12DRAFT_906612 [Pisolithus orientalis]KAI6000286.1 hypothetical protein F5J12DRAFT_906612 [Pisolithus orientalis]
MASHTPHRTPLKRISQGSLFALSRSGHNPDAPHGLGFLEPVMSELVDEAEFLLANVEGLGKLSQSLRTFNENFASFLYVMDMNALTTDWPQAPTDASFQLARRRAEEDARIAAEAASKAAAAAPPAPPPDIDADKTTYTENADYETTFMTTANVTNASTTTTATTKPSTKTKKKAKPKLSAKEKKERSLMIEKLISCLPLEFRGSDPSLRRSMESIIEAMMDSEGRGVKLIELIAPPDLNQARVNKCLIALVNRKLVRKDNSTGTVLYHWHGLP